MLRNLAPQKYFSFADIGVLMLLGTIIYGLVAIGQAWGTSFHAATPIDLSLSALPYYVLLSGMRGIVAFILSVIFTLVVGYSAAKSPLGEKILIPMIDILQSIPVLGFLPGLVLALIALFPRTNLGLELASVLMIFTGQVWNMTFSFYSSIKSIPADYSEVADVIGLNWWQRLLRIELPFSAVNLAWNGVMSMAGGWFFLSVCEAFTLGEQQYRLPGIGAYMAVAIAAGDYRAILSGVVAMTMLIVVLDMLVWRPILGWVHQYRLEEVAGAKPTEPIIQLLIRDSQIFRWLTLLYRRNVVQIRLRSRQVTEVVSTTVPKRALHTIRKQRTLFLGLLGKAGFAVFAVVTVYGGIRLGDVMSTISLATWGGLVVDALTTLARVIFCIIFSSLWAVPVGIWIGISPKRIRVAQPIIQLMASFPAPMLYPLLLAALMAMGMSFDWAAMFLMTLGVQWYVLFNVLAGATRIPQELGYALALMRVSRKNYWRVLFLPAIFPSLVTGWITAAGGAWNASIAAEYLVFRGNILAARGLGSTISTAASSENFPLLAASLTVMVTIVIILNRTFWARAYWLAQNRFKLEG